MHRVDFWAKQYYLDDYVLWASLPYNDDRVNRINTCFQRLYLEGISCNFSSLQGGVQSFIDGPIKVLQIGYNMDNAELFRASADTQLSLAYL